MKKHLRYGVYLARHKWFVFRAGLRVGAPLWRLIIHDWSKFLPCEWLPYATYFYGSAYPPVCDRGENCPFCSPRRLQVKSGREAAFDRAWLHHQHSNPHHWQHWVLREDSGAMKLLEMPLNFAREMVADWMGAGRAITGKWEAAEWYAKNREIIRLHPVTRAVVETLLAGASQKEKA